MTGVTERFEGFMGIVADRDDDFRLQPRDEGAYQCLARPAFGGGVTAVGEGIVRFVGMKGKDIPQERWRRKSADDSQTTDAVRSVTTGPVVARLTETAP